MKNRKMWTGFSRHGEVDAFLVIVMATLLTVLLTVAGLVYQDKAANRVGAPELFSQKAEIVAPRPFTEEECAFRDDIVSGALQAYLGHYGRVGKARAERFFKVGTEAVMMRRRLK